MKSCHVPGFPCLLEARPPSFPDHYPGPQAANALVGGIDFAVRIDRGLTTAWCCQLKKVVVKHSVNHPSSRMDLKNVKPTNHWKNIFNIFFIYTSNTNHIRKRFALNCTRLKSPFSRRDGPFTSAGPVQTLCH